MSSETFILPREIPFTLPTDGTAGEEITAAVFLTGWFPADHTRRPVTIFVMPREGDFFV